MNSSSGSIKGGILQSGKPPVASSKIDDSGPRSGSEDEVERPSVSRVCTPGSFPQKLSGTILPFATKTI
jgi:hypothetical protein